MNKPWFCIGLTVIAIGLMVAVVQPIGVPLSIPICFIGGIITGANIR